MATTVGKIVNRALRLIGQIDPAEDATGWDMETAIEALNAMVYRWEANGLALGWVTVDNPSDELPVPDEAHQAVAYQLAMRIAPEYGKMAPPDVTAAGKQFLDELRRDQAVATPIRPILDIPVPDAGHPGIASRFRSTVWEY